MKKLLAVLLAILMLGGVFAVGAGAAAGSVSPRNKEENRDFYIANVYYGLIGKEFGYIEYSNNGNGILAALQPGKTYEDFKDEYNLALDMHPRYEFFDDGDFSIRTDYTACDAVLAEYFNDQFVNDFFIYKKARTNHINANYELVQLVGRDYEGYKEEYNAIMDAASNMPFDTLPGMAAIQQFCADEINALIMKIAPPSFFTIIWNFILRYILFGWLWMR